MGRQALQRATFEHWRSRFRCELRDEFGSDFAAAAMRVLDDEIAYYGEPDEAERKLYEATIPTLTRHAEARRG